MLNTEWKCYDGSVCHLVRTLNTLSLNLLGPLDHWKDSNCCLALSFKNVAE
jgi:hypothetical protein